MKSINIPVLHQDQDIVVINKPAGLVVNRSETVRGPTAQDWFEEWLKNNRGVRRKRVWQQQVPEEFNDQYGTPEEVFERRLGLAHRLDKDTSGVLLLAKHPGSLVNLLTQFKQRQVQKKYWCLVHGQPQVESAEINAPLNRSPFNRRQFRVDIDGKRAVTYYQVLKQFDQLDFDQLRSRISRKRKIRRLEAQWNSYQQGFALVECFPKTGRTHQIRVHLRHIGHPLVADEIYGGSQRSKLDQIWCPRQFLHARWIEFAHPRTGERVHAAAPLADELKAVLALME